MIRVHALAPKAIVAVAIFAAACGGSANSSPTATITAPTAAPSLSVTPGLSIVTTASPSASPTAGPTETPMPGDAAKASALLDAYERALVDSKWREAWDMLSPAQQARWLSMDTSSVPSAIKTQWGGLAWYVYDRAAYFHSVAGRYKLSPPTHDAATVELWTSGGMAEGADLGRGFIVRVDYPALAGNNAGWEVFLAAPDASGDWRIWIVR